MAEMVWRDSSPPRLPSRLRAVVLVAQSLAVRYIEPCASLPYRDDVVGVGAPLIAARVLAYRVPL